MNKKWEDELRWKKNPAHKAGVSYDYRCWQAEKIGFTKISIKNLIKLLMGDVFIEEEKEKDNVHRYEWVYNHLTDRDESERWVYSSSCYNHYQRKGLFKWPPFTKSLDWSYRFCNLRGLKSEIPPAVILKILRVQSLNVFNAFHAVEGMKPERKPIFLATIWELPPHWEKTSKLKFFEIGDVTHFFLSEWHADV